VCIQGGQKKGLCRHGGGMVPDHVVWGRWGGGGVEFWASILTLTFETTSTVGSSALRAGHTVPPRKFHGICV